MPLEDGFESNEKKIFKIVIYLLTDFSIKGANSTQRHRSPPVTAHALVLSIICNTASRRTDRWIVLDTNYFLILFFLWRNRENIPSVWIY